MRNHQYCLAIVKEITIATWHSDHVVAKQICVITCVSNLVSRNRTQNLHVLNYRKESWEAYLFTYIKLPKYNTKAYLQSVKYTYAALYLLDDLVMKSSISPSTDLWVLEKWGKKSLQWFCLSFHTRQSFSLLSSCPVNYPVPLRNT